MRWLISCFLLASAGLVQALSSSGSRLLVVLEEAADKALFSQFSGDLEGQTALVELRCRKRCTDDRMTERGFKLTFESPKNDKLSLFRHGELAYDHLILTPPKSKGLRPSHSLRIFADACTRLRTFPHAQQAP